MRNRVVLILSVVVSGAGILAGAAGAAFPGRNGLIGYTIECCLASNYQDYYLRLVAPDGSRARQIPVPGTGFAFSPDGGLLLNDSGYGFGLSVREADGRGGFRRLTREDDFWPDWSPTGRRIVFTRTSLNDAQIRSGEVWIRGPAGARRLVAGEDPSWSARDEIAFSTLGGIDVIRPDGSGLRRLVNDGREPDWSPSGRRLVYSASGSIWTVRTNGSGARRLRRGTSPAYSPDGHKIVYLGPGGLVRIMGAGGKRDHRLPDRRNQAYEDEDFEAPDWQPLPRRQRGP